MAINNVKDTQSLLTDIEDWMNNPKFQPQEQNKWFFGEGLSYYTQLCEVVKVLTYLQDNFKIVIANEKSLEQAYNEVKDLPSQFTVLSNRVDELSNTVSDLPTRVQELETKVTKLISDVSSQLTRIETLEGSVSTNTGSITTLNSEVDNIKVKDGEQDVKIEKLQSDVVSINAKDISQDSEIASIKSKNQEQDTLIDSNTNKITTLEGKDFLQQVAFNNSATITFTDEGKQEGTQTFSASVTGSIPANLTPNLAYLNNNPNTNIVSNVVLTWNVNENKCYLKKDMSYYSNGNINTVTSRLELDSAWFTINENTLTLKASVLDNYLTKDDAPGYADILTTANAKTTYVAKNEATGYNDILTKTLAGATYETIENASTTYETKQNATSTYETKANASATYVSKAEAVGYDDILTNANAKTTYETKANASATYETKQHATATYETKANASATYTPLSRIALYSIYDNSNANVNFGNKDVCSGSNANCIVAVFKTTTTSDVRVVEFIPVSDTPTSYRVTNYNAQNGSIIARTISVSKTKIFVEHGITINNFGGDNIDDSVLIPLAIYKIL